MPSAPALPTFDHTVVEPCPVCDTEAEIRCPACNSTGWMVVRRIERVELVAAS
jgi:hypothetical protein